MCEIKDGDVFENTHENRLFVAWQVIKQLMGDDIKEDCCINAIITFNGLKDILKSHIKVSEDQKSFIYNYFTKAKQECVKKLNN
jgi:hypothetical protein